MAHKAPFNWMSPLGQLAADLNHASQDPDLIDLEILAWHAGRILRKANNAGQDGLLARDNYEASIIDECYFNPSGETHDEKYKITASDGVTVYLALDPYDHDFIGFVREVKDQEDDCQRYGKLRWDGLV